MQSIFTGKFEFVSAFAGHCDRKCQFWSDCVYASATRTHSNTESICPSVHCVLGLYI